MYPRILRLAAFAVTLLAPATAQVSALRIRFIEGEGAVHAPGKRVNLPLTIEVTDEAGAAVSGAAVSFHLPEDGPGGTLANGLRTDVSITDAQGRATLRVLRANRIPGRFQIRIVASKEQARAGVISQQYIAEPGSGDAAQPRRRSRWIVVAAAVAGGAAAGIWSAGRSSTPASPPSPPVSPPSTVTIGAPSSTVGKP